MEKAGANVDQLGQLKQMFNSKMSQLDNEFGDSLNKLNRGEKLAISGGTTAGIDIDQSKLPDASMQKNLGKSGMFKRLGKKVAGVIPLAGAAYGLASGDPAMAAEEAAADVPVLGQAYEALKSEDAGNRNEEREMLSERNAMDSYRNSQAYRDARGMDESDEAMSDMAEARKNALKGIRGY
jgi:hypothetical protein